MTAGTTIPADDSEWLVAMAPLRADVLAGDRRLFYLLWLTGVQNDRARAWTRRNPWRGSAR